MCRGIEHLPRQAGDDLDRIGAADADGAGAEPAGVGRVRVGADDQLAGKGVILQHHLVDDAGARPPEAGAVLRRRRAQEIVDLLVLRQRLAQVGRPLDARLDQMVAMDRGRHSDFGASRLHELEQARLAEHVLKDDAVGPQQQVAFAGLEFLMLRIVEVPEQDLVRESQRLAQSPAHHREIARHRRVDRGRHFRGRFDRNHCPAFLAHLDRAGADWLSSG